MNALRRKLPGLKTKLAAALCALTDARGDRLIPHDHAKQMHEDQVISLFNFDHYPIRHEAGGPAVHWNLDPRLIPDHRIKTAKHDIPEAAKIKRVTPDQEAFRRKMLAKAGIETEASAPVPRKPTRKIQSPSFPKSHRPLQNANKLRRRDDFSR